MPITSPWRRHLPDGQLPPSEPRAPRRKDQAAHVTEEYVRCIRDAHAAGATLAELMARFPKLRRSAIQSIVYRTSWRHLP